MEPVVFILIVIGCILCHTWSTSYNQTVERKYCQDCINWWWSVTIAVLLAGTLLTIDEEVFGMFLVLTLVAVWLSAWLCYRKMIGWGATSGEAWAGAMAQVASAVGIAAAILLFLFLVFGDSGKKRRRRGR